MAEGARAGELLRCVEADIRFHEFVLSRSGQPHTTQVWRSIAPRIRAYFFRYGRDGRPHADRGRARPAARRRCRRATGKRADGRGRAPHHGQDARPALDEPEPSCCGSRTCARRSAPSAGLIRAVDGVDFELDAGAHARRRRRVGQRQVGHGALDHGPARRARPRSSRAAGSCSRGATSTKLGERELGDGPRQRDLDDLPGADDLAEPRLLGRRADRRGRPPPRGRRRQGGDATRAQEMLELVGIPEAGAAAQATTRTSCRAGCASA